MLATRSNDYFFKNVRFRECSFFKKNLRVISSSAIIYKETTTITKLSHSRTWRTGPPLPHTGYEMTSAQLFNTFLLVGGNGGVSEALSTVLQFDIYSQDWVSVANLDQGRYFASAVAVPDDFFQC